MLGSADEKQEKVLAVMSPFLLRIALTNASESGSPLLMSKESDELLGKILDLSENFGWREFELFHAYHETLRFRLMYDFEMTESASLGKLYPGAIFPSKKSKKQMLLESVPIHRRLHSSETHQLTELSQTWCAAHANEVVSMAAGNKGFDIAIPFGEDCVVLIDTKHSAAASSSRIHLARDIISPRKNSFDLLNTGILLDLFFEFHVELVSPARCFAGGLVRPSKVFMVIAAWRPSGRTGLVDEDATNTLVLDRDSLKLLYGETLSSFIALAEMNAKFAEAADITDAASKSAPESEAQL